VTHVTIIRRYTFDICGIEDNISHENLNMLAMLNLLKGIFKRNTATIESALANGAAIIDVRTPAEFKQGHILGSQNIPLDEIKSKIRLIQGWKKPVITVCLSGGRSAVAKSVLEEAGIEAYNGGSWTQLKNLNP
jgi:phage shock protein E